MSTWISPITYVPIDIFCKNAVLNICRYLKRFYTYKKMNSINLKFDHSLLRMPKIIGIGHFCQKARFKNITNM